MPRRQQAYVGSIGFKVSFVFRADILQLLFGKTKAAKSLSETKLKMMVNSVGLRMCDIFYSNIYCRFVNVLRRRPVKFIMTSG